MYTQPHNRMDDRATLLAFIHEHPFATLVSSGDGVPHATHLPLAIDCEGEAVRLSGHVSKANPQWQDFAEGRPGLAIFQAPHAYISPRHYETAVAAPTWNYVAVHASGPIRLVDPRESGMARLRRLVRAHDAAYEAQLDALPPEWLETRLKGIAMFELEVTKLEGRWKLSQDRSPAERDAIAADLLVSDDPAARAIGEMMRERLAAEAAE